MPDFVAYCERYFARLCRGYADSLDDTFVRAWLPGMKNEFDQDGSWIAPARMFPALAAWLAHPERERAIVVHGRSYDLEALAVTILEHAFDPAASGHWGGPGDPPFSQETVETSQLAYGLWLLRDRVLPQLSEAAVRNVRVWLDHFTSGELPAYNKALFVLVTHAARKALGWEYRQDLIDDGWKLIEGMHRGDGWFTDGRERAFDDYNWWVFGTYGLMWAQLDGDANPSRRARVFARAADALESFPYFFGADGAYSEYGRSLSYKFARLGFPLLAYRLGLWPHDVGVLKRLVHRHLAYYDDAGAIDPDSDVVRQELSASGHVDVREPYIDTGHPYWCMQAFTSLWQLDGGDPLWTVEEQPLPVERADFTRVIRPAGWILSGSSRSGQVQRHSLGSAIGSAKYAKFTYSSLFPVNVGVVDGATGPDAALCVTDGDRWAHPEGVSAFVAGDAYLRARFALRVGGTVVVCETVLVPDGEGVLRVHRVRVPDDAARLRVVEGGVPFGYAAGATVEATIDDRTSAVSGFGRVCAITALAGYTRPLAAQGFKGRDDLNLVHARALTPLLEVANVEPGSEFTLVAYAFAGAAPMPDVPPISVDWRDDDSVRIDVGSPKKTTLTIPALP